MLITHEVSHDGDLNPTFSQGHLSCRVCAKQLRKFSQLAAGLYYDQCAVCTMKGLLQNR